MSTRPRLVTWLDGRPCIESVAPLLARIQERGILDLGVFIPAGKFPPENEILQQLATAGVNNAPVSRLRSKIFFHGDLKSADAVITINDPALDRSSRRFRSYSIKRSGKPVIFLQHGAYQTGVNAPLPSGPAAPIDFHADLLLLWQCAAPEAAILSESTRSRVKKCGFVKKRFLPLMKPEPEVQAWTRRYAHRVLLCQSLRWRGDRYEETAAKDWYDMLDAFLARNRDIGVLLRPHRGKAHRIHRSFDAALMARYDNLLISQENEGPLRGASIHDCVSLCQSVVCPESTVVLDALYMDRNVMIWDRQKLIFVDLPRVESIDDIAAFARDPTRASPACEEVRACYGDVEHNLDLASRHIEALMTARS